MKDLSKELLKRLKKMRKEKGNNIDIEDIDAVIHEFVEIVKKCTVENDKYVYQEIKGLRDKIKETKREIAETLSTGAVVDATMELDAVVDATMELDAVVESTEDATNKILDAVEHIQELVSHCSDKELAEKVVVDISSVFEACNFQDLTGQRIHKVTATLSYIESAVGNLLESFGSDNIVTKDKKSNDKLINGPQLKEHAPNQKDVDQLFDSAW